jgi:hypothetical protein
VLAKFHGKKTCFSPVLKYEFSVYFSVFKTTENDFSFQ